MRKQLWTRLTAAALAALLTAALPTGISAAAREDTAPPVEEPRSRRFCLRSPQSPQETPDEPDTPSAEEPTPVPQESLSRRSCLRVSGASHGRKCRRRRGALFG